MLALGALARDKLPGDDAIEWTDVAYQQEVAGGYAPLIFGLGALMIFPLLAGQYEFLRLPPVILLATPVAMFGVVGFLAIRGLELDVLGPIGLPLVGLAAKNSTLLVAFAEDARRRRPRARACARS